MNIDTMRKNLANLYGAGFVKKMKDDQVVAVHKRLQQNGKIK